MHAHVAAFPYLDVTKISIWQPCLNFAVYSSHMLPCRLRQLDVLLALLSPHFKVSCLSYMTLQSYSSKDGQLVDNHDNHGIQTGSNRYSEYIDMFQ